MSRYVGKGILKQTYNVTDYHPLDTRMLVPYYEDLTTESNWMFSGESIAYNGMIVAVGNDTTKNGVYYLFDINNPTEDDIPDVALESNWHKLCELSQLQKVSDQISNLTQTIGSISERVDALEAQDHVHTYGYKKDFPVEGEDGHLYVAADLQRTYAYTTAAGYVLVGAGFREEEDGQLIIDGGDANVTESNV